MGEHVCIVLQASSVDRDDESGVQGGNEDGEIENCQ